MRIFAGFAFGLILAGCGTVQQETVVSNNAAGSQVAGVGDVILKAEGRESLPNIVGGADIFGRTRSTGLTTVQFGGMQGNKVLLLRSGVTTQSDATTMNAGPGRDYTPPAITASQQPNIPILVDWKTTPSVPMLGHTLLIENASATSLTYQIQ